MGRWGRNWPHLFRTMAIKGIFDANYFEIMGVDGGVESTQPGVVCRSGDVAGIGHGAAVVADGVSYTVVGVKPDGTGITELALERV